MLVSEASKIYRRVTGSLRHLTKTRRIQIQRVVHGLATPTRSIVGRSLPTDNAQQEDREQQEWTGPAESKENQSQRCQHCGQSHRCGIGSDLDGGFGFEQTPLDLNTIADLRRLPELMVDRGYSAEDIVAIKNGNWLRRLGDAWKA